MTNHPNRAKKIAIYTRNDDGTIKRDTSGMTEAQYIAHINEQARDHLGTHAPQWSSDEKKTGELMGWPERYVHWYGDKFAIAQIKK